MIVRPPYEALAFASSKLRCSEGHVDEVAAGKTEIPVGYPPISFRASCIGYGTEGAGPSHALATVSFDKLEARNFQTVACRPQNAL